MDSSENDLKSIRHLIADLTTRISRIERQLGIATASAIESPPPSFSALPPASKAPEPSAAPSPPKSVVTPVSVPRIHASPSHAATTAQFESNLESRIGSHLLNRIGIAALLIGVSYFLKFAFDSNWIGPAGRVAIGLIAGIAVVLWSERFRARGYNVFSYSLKAVGLGTLYLSLWAAFQVYSLIPSSIAFATMLTVTAATATMAIAQDAEILAAFALSGGFTTPLLLSTGQNHEIALFTYVAVLDIATLALLTFKPWRRLLVLSYAGTLLLYIGWYSSFYERTQLSLTVAFSTLFFAIFALAPLIARQSHTETTMFTAILLFLAFVNAVVYFLQVYAMVSEVSKTDTAWFALGLAAVYIFLSRLAGARLADSAASNKLRFLHLALAIGFITVAIPIRLDAHWITIGWFVEAGVLLWVADRIESDFLNAFAIGAMILGVGRLLLIDNFVTTQLIFNMRMATYSVAVAVLAAVAWFARNRSDEAGRTVAAVSIIALNLLALTALSHEITDYYARRVAEVRIPYGQWNRSNGSDIRGLQIARDFSYSALWMFYGAALMVIGFSRRSAFVRWQALVLVAATIVKVFVYDVSQLDREYRIVSFIVLGVLLLAISFVYQRDWLQLTSRPKPNAEGTSVTI